ncbi:hypothetical protein D3C72_2571750 [compost metagenome]
MRGCFCSHILGIFVVRTDLADPRRARAGEGNQLVTAQHHAADMAIDAVVGILELEGALETEPAIFPARQP